MYTETCIARIAELVRSALKRLLSAPKIPLSTIPSFILGKIISGPSKDSQYRKSVMCTDHNKCDEE